jgi:predicted nucleic acid-binding protein
MGDLLVVDASVAVKWVLREAGRENAVDLLSGGSVLIAPDVIRLELSNVITKRERRKAITSEQATEAFGLVTGLSPELH